MRLMILLAGLVCTLLLCEQPVTHIIDIDPIDYVDSTLVLSLEMNGNVVNTSAYSQLVDYSSIVYGPDLHGVSNQALAFNGVDSSSVRIADHPSLDFSRSSFTLSLWIKTGAELLERTGIITKGYATQEQYCVDILQNRLRFWVRGSSGEEYVLTSTVVLDYAWHKLDAVRDAEADSLFLYCDSVIIGACIAPEVLFATSEPLSIGECNGISGESMCRFRGSIDQVQVYSKAIRIPFPEKVEFVAVSDSALLLEIDNGVVNTSVYSHTIGCYFIAYGPDRTGTLNQALFFNGIDAAGIRIADHPSIDFSHSSFTLSLWINAATDQMSAACIVAKGLTDKEQYCIDIHQNRFRFRVRGNGGEEYTVMSTAGPDNQWHRLDAVYDALVDSLFFYHDSVIVGKLNAPDALFPTSEMLIIGGQLGPSGESVCRFRGSIDQVQLYRKVMPIAAPDSVDPKITPTSDSILLLEIANSVVNMSPYTHAIELSSVVYGPDRYGMSNQALSFSGVDSSSVRVADHQSLNFLKNSFTLSLWVKAMTNQVNGAGIITKGLAGSEQYCIDVYQNRFRFRVRDNGGENYFVTSTVILDNNWHKLDAVRNADVDSLFFYSDSVLVGKCISPDVLFATSAPLVIGEPQGLPAGNVSRFRGAIDQVQLYGKAIRIPPPVQQDTIIAAAQTVLSLEIANSVVNASEYTHTIDCPAVTYGPDRNGVANQALCFNGVDSSSVRVADHPSLNFGQGSFTISLWLKPSTGQNTVNGIIAKGIAGKEQYCIDINQYRFRFWVRDDKGSEYVIDTDVAPDYKWHKFDAIYNGDIDSLLLYRDAQLIGKAKAPAALLSTAEPLCIGERKGLPGESPYRFKGSIDQVQMYNFPLHR